MEADFFILQKTANEMRNTLLDFHSRKLIFVKGPEGITVELPEGH